MCVFSPPFFSDIATVFFSSAPHRPSEKERRAQGTKKRGKRKMFSALESKRGTLSLSLSVAGIGGRRRNKIDVACPPRGGEGGKSQ